MAPRDRLAQRLMVGVDAADPRAARRERARHPGGRDLPRRQRHRPAAPTRRCAGCRRWPGSRSRWRWTTRAGGCSASTTSTASCPAPARWPGPLTPDAGARARRRTGPRAAGPRHHDEPRPDRRRRPASGGRRDRRPLLRRRPRRGQQLRRRVRRGAARARASSPCSSTSPGTGAPTATRTGAASPRRRWTTCAPTDLRPYADLLGPGGPLRRRAHRGDGRAPGRPRPHRRTCPARSPRRSTRCCAARSASTAWCSPTTWARWRPSPASSRCPRPSSARWPRARTWRCGPAAAASTRCWTTWTQALGRLDPAANDAAVTRVAAREARVLLTGHHGARTPDRDSAHPDRDSRTSGVSAGCRACSIPRRTASIR